MNLDPSTIKYLIKARIQADGIVEKPDVVGAIFGQTEGLIGEELDLRDLQKTGRMGRIEVDMKSNKGKSEGEILIPSSLDQVETAILAASLETIDRVGPCKAKIHLVSVEDVRAERKQKIIDRSKEILHDIMSKSKTAGLDIAESVRQAVQVEEIVLYGDDKCPAGPNVESSDAIIVVEGRSDVINLLKYGIKNCVAVGGTNVPKTIVELSQKKVVTAFVDGDRGGELIVRELMQVTEIDHIARAPRGYEVEELTQKQIVKALRNKIDSDQFAEQYSVGSGYKDYGGKKYDKNGKKGGNKRGRGKQQNQKKETPPPPPKSNLNPEQQGYKDNLAELSGTLKAKLIGPNGEDVDSVAVRNLADTLSEPPQPIETVIFDGIISQRILDIAASNGIKTIVGVKMGNITKAPADIKIYSKTDLE